MADVIRIKNARQHNLKGFDVEIPRRRLTVLLGVSGSGKSSLAFDTLYAEGQRRYVESLSTYAKQFLERMPRPAVDAVEGISPAVAIEQKNPTTSARSTVGTTTEVYDYLRLLFARVGRTVCPECQEEVRPDTVTQVADRLLGEAEGEQALVCFPLRPSEELTPEAVTENLRAMGFIRVLAGGEILRIDEEELPALDGELQVVVDRISLTRDRRSRLADSLETAFAEGEGEAIVRLGATEKRFTEGYRCRGCRCEFPAPVPVLFSFNNPYGACPTCRGFGNTLEYDPALIVPDRERSLEEGALKPWTWSALTHRRRQLREFCDRAEIPMDRPFREFPEETREVLLGGDGEFVGIIPWLRGLEPKRYKRFIRFFLRRFQSYRDCPTCQGARVRSEALNVRVGGRSVADLSRMDLRTLRDFLGAIELTEFESRVAATILGELTGRLDFLLGVGLHYLTLGRLTRTLSGGEYQRVNLANSLGARLAETLYVLDEPTVGLHPRDTGRLLAVLEQLRDLGNTVLVVEHDPQVMARADHCIELGPGSGDAGGEVIFVGPYEDLRRSQTITGAYLRGERTVPIPMERRGPADHHLVISGPTEHNLKGMDVAIPLGRFVAVTGVSGSGKSTLVHDVLYRASRLTLTGERPKGAHRGDRIGAHRGLDGTQHLSGVVLVDQSPIGGTPRANPVTYIKAFTPIRETFAATWEARRQGLEPRHFSFNVSGGRCDVCKGDGHLKVEMQFMADIYVPCEACGGRRYRPEVLEVTHRGASIADVLDMTVDQAVSHFQEEERVAQELAILPEVGLGYLRLGQSAPTLSGGESQRLKIARELNAARRSREQPGRGILYLLDEPTVGLHFQEVERLVRILQSLVDQGHSVVVIEHNLEVIKQADWIIDLGPEGGDEGGEVVAVGPPEEVAVKKVSHTGRYLREALAGVGAAR